jgi:hypothetical protein
MGSIENHSVKRVEVKRTVNEYTRYKLSYNFDIVNRKIEKKLLNVDYLFSVDYVENIGRIEVEGTVSYKDTAKALKDLDGNWDKDVPARKMIYNNILRNGLSMVLDLTRHLGLPPPILIPEIRPK